ncbi:hypothetical protein GLOIN_2v1673942 [Rhizophagus irregularis DAOM 181602=DAOM 197198]|nr:hypothetical protein GLOIN_2v1673942 [Rhizophagus irregularis DAOM 181602=DAOM 197198]
MEEDYVADTQITDVGVNGPSSSPQQNVSGENTLTSSLKKSAAPSAPSHVVSSRNVDASMHAPSNKDLQQPPNASPNMDITGVPDETYESFTGKARMTGSGEAKRLIIHFHTDEARDLCVGSTHPEFPDLIFHAHDPRQLRSNEDQRAIQDINLAPLTRDLGAKAVNVLLSLNSYKPKRWAYVTFNSQETMDAAMEQTVSFQDKVLFWFSPDNTNKLCHRCGKLGCAPNFCPLKQTRGYTRTHDPVIKLKEQFNVNQPPRRSNPNAANSRSCSRSRSKSKDRSASNSRRDINNSQDHNNNVNNNNIPNPNTSRRAWHNIANFHKRISALELADQWMARIETHLGLDPLPTPNEPDLDLMQDDAPISHVPLNIQPSAKASLPLRLQTYLKVVTLYVNMSM